MLILITSVYIDQRQVNYDFSLIMTCFKSFAFCNKLVIYHNCPT
jgi:hypothetical protein